MRSYIWKHVVACYLINDVDSASGAAPLFHIHRMFFSLKAVRASVRDR